MTDLALEQDTRLVVYQSKKDGVLDKSVSIKQKGKSIRLLDSGSVGPPTYLLAEQMKYIRVCGYTAQTE